MELEGQEVQYEGLMKACPVFLSQVKKDIIIHNFGKMFRKIDICSMGGRGTSKFQSGV